MCRLRAHDDTPIGWALEPLVYLAPSGGCVVGDELSLPVAASASAAEVEHALYGRAPDGLTAGDGMAGMWVAIVLTGSRDDDLRRVYLAATHSAVFSRYHGVVAATPNLVPGLRRDHALSTAFDPLATKAFFTFGLTGFQGVQRLLPNHHLDLDTFEPQRHWPQGGLDMMDDGADGAAAVVDHSRRLLDAVATVHRDFRIFLSAGRDSRAIVALLAPLLSQQSVNVTLETSVDRSLERRTDLQAARRLARICGLPHLVHRRPSREDVGLPRLMDAFARIGEAKAGSSLVAAASGETPPDQRGFALAGMAGETARGFYWDRHTAPSGYCAPAAVTPELLASRIRSPQIPQVLEAADRWMSSLPPELRASPANTLDLAYIEQRLGCWESPSRYLWPGRPRVTSPMTAAFNLQTMLRLPEPYRGAGVLQRDMVAYGWPELLRVPFNSPRGMLAVRSYWERRRAIAGRILRRLQRRI